MTWDDWLPHYRRLVKTYNKTESGEQCAAYFEVLKGFTPLVIERAITRTLAEEKYFPAVSDIREHASYVMAGMLAPASICDVCHGDTWVDAEPLQANGVTYTNVVRRCRQCVPQPAGVA